MSDEGMRPATVLAEQAIDSGEGEDRLLRETQVQIEEELAPVPYKPESHLNIMQTLAVRDLRTAARYLGKDEARFLVDYYYEAQHYRIQLAGQLRSRAEGEPYVMLEALFDQFRNVEQRVKYALNIYTLENPVGRWLQAQYGIGPVIAAGLLSHIDIHKAPAVGHIWSFAGLNPLIEWLPGQRRPWNADLKVLCWKAGVSFMKFHKREDCHFGHLYIQRKALEIERNETGVYAADAAVYAQRKKKDGRPYFGKETKAYIAYTAGKLPDGHIDARARRYAVKLFLSHLHAAWFYSEFKQLPPAPYAIAHLGHAHYVPIPRADTIEGFVEALHHGGWQDKSVSARM